MKWAYEAIDEVLPTDVHMAMVIPALAHQTSPEQREKWLPLATSFEILCAYVQTELGHGSNVRGLETTATFDQVRGDYSQVSTSSGVAEGGGGEGRRGGRRETGDGRRDSWGSGRGNSRALQSTVHAIP